MEIQKKMYPVQIKLFGECEVVSLTNSTVNTLKGSNALLFAFILLRDGQCKKQILINRFYPDTNDPKRNLRVALHRLKATLPKGMMNSSRDEIWINSEVVISVDVQQFQQTLKKANVDWLHFGQEGSDLTAIQHVLRSYRGEFLAHVVTPNNLTIDRWLMMERITLHYQYVTWGERLVQQYLMNEAWRSAENLLDQMLSIEPFHEKFCRMKVMAMAEQGQFKEALAQAKVYEKLLEENLNITLSPSLRQTIEKVKQKIDLPQLLPLPDEPINVYKIRGSREVVFGRENEIKELATVLLERNSRLLALVGMGGVGKTVMVREIGRSTQPLFKNGAVFVSFQSVPYCVERETAEQQIMIALCKGFEVEVEQIGMKKSLFSTVQKQEVVVILDDIDCVLAGYELLTEILHHAPQLKIVTTSHREPPTHRFDGHTTEHILGLDEADAVSIFFYYAKKNIKELQLDSEGRKKMSEICRLVGNNPLATKLAASWLMNFSLSQIIDRLKKDILTLDRTKQITTIMEETWVQLSHMEQEIVAKLSLFAHRFDHESAAHMTDIAYEKLFEFVRRGILLSYTHGVYQLHPLVCLFAAEKLATNKQWRMAAQKTYCDYYYQLMRRYGNDQINQILVTQIKTETDDLKNVSQLLLISPDYSNKQKQLFIFRNTSYFHQIGREYEFNTVLQGLVKLQLPNPIIQSSIYLTLAESAATHYHDGNGISYLKQAHKILIDHKELEDEHILLLVPILGYMSYLYQHYGRVDQIKACLHQIEQIEQKHTLSIKILSGLRSLFGLASLFMGNLDQAEAQFKEAITLTQKVNDQREESLAWGNLGRVYTAKEQFVQAEATILKGLILAEKVQDATKISNLINHKIDLDLSWGHFGDDSITPDTVGTRQGLYQVEREQPNIVNQLREVIIAYEMGNLDETWRKLHTLQEQIISSEEDTVYIQSQCYALKAGLFKGFSYQERSTYLVMALQYALELGNTPAAVFPLCATLMMDVTVLPKSLVQAIAQFVSTEASAQPYIRTWARRVVPDIAKTPIVSHAYQADVNSLLEQCIDVYTS